MGFTRIGSSTFVTTGILGISRNAAGEDVQLGFPGWMTLPSWRALAWGRRWHFFFAWLFVANLLVEEQVVNDVLLHAQPTRKFVTTEQIGGLAMFLCTEAGASITGTALPIDGGWTAQ